MTRITENDVMLNNEKNDVPLPKKMTRITENDVILNNEKNAVPLPKKMKWITENDIMLNNEKMLFLYLKKWHEFGQKFVFEQNLCQNSYINKSP